MPATFYQAIDLQKNELRQAAVQSLATAPPTPVAGQLWYDSAANIMKWFDGTVWQSAQPGAGTPPATAVALGSVQLAGDLGGTATAPIVADGAITSAKIADGTIVAADLAPGTIPASTPPSGAAGGALAGTYPNPTLAPGTITTAEITDGTIQAADLAPGTIPTALPPNGAAGGSLAGTFPNPTLAAGAVTTTEIADGTITATDLAAGVLTPYQLTSEKGTANGYAALDAGGVIPTNQLPPLAINNTFTVADQAAMLALTAQTGDMAVRADTGETYVLAGASAATLTDWVRIAAPGQVSSVNGQTGVVSLTAANVGAPTATTSLTAGAGLVGGGDLSAARTFDVGAGTGILVAADTVSIDPAVVVRKFAAALTGTASPEVITHNLNTQDVSVTVYNTTTGTAVEVDWDATSVNTVTVRYSPALGAGYRIVVMG